MSSAFKTLKMKKVLILILFFTVAQLPAQVSHLYDNGVALFRQGDYKGTKIIMTRVIKKSPYYFEAYTYRARAFEALGMTDSAKVDFQTALEKKPDYLPAIFYRGVLHFMVTYRKSLLSCCCLDSKFSKTCCSFFPSAMIL